MTFLILTALIVIAVLTWEDIRENRRHGRDIVLHINGEALDDRQAEFIAQRIAGALDRPISKDAA